MERCVEGARAMPLTGPQEGVAAADLVVVDAGEVHRSAVSRSDRVAWLTERLQPPHSDRLFAAPVEGEELVADAEVSTRQCAGDDRAGAGCRERTIDPESWSVAVDGGRRGVQGAIERQP